jgi:pimeloyl-ACP methyl ester carboxylesterase
MQIKVGDNTFEARVAGPDDGEPVVLLHGFPQTSYSWRSQLEALGAAGYRAVAPDQRGYSPGARPTAVEAYTVDHLVDDVVGMADALGVETFHLVGHDWGAAVAWATAITHPDRVRSLVALSVPHPDAFRRAFSGESGSDQSSRSSYVEFFVSDGAAETFTANGGDGLRNMFAISGLGDGDVQPYVDVLTQPGAMQAALNWYRAGFVGGGEGERPPSGPCKVPTMFIWSTEDGALGPEGARWTEHYVEAPYRFEVIEGVGHWIAESVPDRVNALLLEHLAGA